MGKLSIFLGDIIFKKRRN